MTLPVLLVISPIIIVIVIIVINGLLPQMPASGGKTSHWIFLKLETVMVGIEIDLQAYGVFSKCLEILKFNI